MAGPGRPRKFDRSAALSRAMELFWEHGYEGTSVSMLTDALGITPTSLYAAFGSKDALFRDAVTLYNAPDTPTDRALALPRTRDAVEAMLRENADAYLDRSTPLGCMVVLSGINLASGHEHIGRYLAECRRQDHEKLRDRIERGITEGDLPQALDADLLAAYCLTFLQGLSIQAKDGCTREVARATIDGTMMGWDRIVQEGWANQAPADTGTHPWTGS